MGTDGNVSRGVSVDRPILAAQYVRKSTDHQKYSTENQCDVIGAYATARGMTVIRTYSDDGISGLTFEKRNALRQLIFDVQAGSAPFAVILVYDVSRWGRYQDVDESAYYEFICRRAGIAVHYCAEQFANDGSTVAALLKGLKRAMAGEFSRDLSCKVFAGQTRLARQGYMLGGLAGYGFRRLLVDQNGTPKCTLAHGERKSLATDRVLLVPGDRDEIATVRTIFSMFALDRIPEREIAAILNKRGIKNGSGRPWRSSAILRILSNEKYAGNNVWNRNSCKLQTAVRRNNPALWVRAEGAISAIIDRRLFEAAHRILLTRGKTTSAGRPRGLTDSEMMERLKALHHRHGYLTRALIDANRELPSAGAYFRRFGGLREPYEAIGVLHRRGKGFTKNGKPRGLSNEEMLAILKQLWLDHGYLTEEIIRTSQIAPHVSVYFTRFGSLRRAYELIGFVPDRERTKSPRVVRGVSNEAILESLRDLLNRHGRLSKLIIDGSTTGPSHGTLAYRFGGLLAAYKLIGYTSHWYGETHVRPHDLSDDDMLNELRKLWRQRGYLSQKLIREVKSVPSCYEYCKRFGGLLQAYRLIGFVLTTHPNRPAHRY